MTPKITSADVISSTQRPPASVSALPPSTCTLSCFFCLLLGRAWAVPCSQLVADRTKAFSGPSAWFA